MKYLIIESTWIRPHLETAGEILSDLKRKNKETRFAWVGRDLKWNDYSVPYLFYLLGCSPEKRVNKFINILKKQNIKSLEFKDDFNKNSILKWAISFNGDLSKLKKFKYKNIPLGMGVASSLISQTKNKNLSTQKYKNKIYKFLYSSALVFERTVKILEIEKPKTVITFNNRLGLCLPIILACNKKRIRVLRHDRGSNYKKYQLFKYDINDPRNFKNIYSDWKKVKNKRKINIAKNYFNKKFDGSFLDEVDKNFTNQQIKNTTPYLPTNKKIITFYCSTEYETDAYVNLKFNQMKAFKKLYAEIKKNKYLHLIIRVHPSLSKKDDLVWNKFISKNVTVVGSTSKYDTYEIMKKSDIVCGYTSRIVLESAFLNIPTISLKDFGWPKDLGILYGESKNVIAKNLKKCLNDKLVFNLDKIFSVSYYYSTYGIKYKYYKPVSINKGYYLNTNLEWKSKIIIFCEYLGFKKIYNFLKKFFLI